MAEETKTLETEAFRAGRTLAEQGQQLVEIREEQSAAFGYIDSLANAVGAPGERTITQRLDGIDQQLDGIERILFALARPQGIGPDAATCPGTSSHDDPVGVLAPEHSS
ncbi:hypothetical protein [Streptomyces sp. WAC 01325]|uniref:hypothetical protein n=1 Tax=Streptomyces sp. WAC 01325 TaxID=2203202 RepID=UPI00163C9A10|nr:hypothetical protein [Streptomyces sp. WAC 01325]